MVNSASLDPVCLSRVPGFPALRVLVHTPSSAAQRYEITAAAEEKDLIAVIKWQRQQEASASFSVSESR